MPRAQERIERAITGGQRIIPLFCLIMIYHESNCANAERFVPDSGKLSVQVEALADAKSGGVLHFGDSICHAGCPMETE